VNISQVAYVVDDLDESLAYWVDVVGVAPFFVYRELELAECRHDGEPIELTLSVALGQAGNMQVELIQQHGDTPSIYLGESSGKAHHVAVWTREYDRDLAAFHDRGLVDKQWGSASGAADERFVYFEQQGQGPMVELVEVLDKKAAMYAEIAEAARTYCGTPPLREAMLSRR
jgi:hypothetical protein